jgi:hypothetical protein
MPSARELRREIAHLQTLLVTVTDDRTRQAIQDFINELERRVGDLDNGNAAGS